MASYLLFLPGTKGADPAQLDRVGLAELRSDRSPEFAESLGHLGQGNLVFWSDKGISPPLDTSLYDWTPLKGFSAGVLKGQRVTPEDIQRSTVRSGYPILMADGQRWQIPAAANLPHRHGLDSEGRHVREVVAQYRDYWDKSQQFALAMFRVLDQLELLAAHTRAEVPDEEIEFTLAETWDFTCRALSINYRLTPALVSWLGLIDDDAMSNTVKAAIDLPVLIDVKREKKTERVGIHVGLSG